MTPSSHDNPEARPFVSIVAARLGFTLAIVGALAAMGAGVGTRLEWWTFRAGFSVLKWGAYFALTAFVASFIGLIGLRRGAPRRDFSLAVAGTLISLVVFLIPLQWMWKAWKVPPIHDITTDTENPPPFVAVLKLREGAQNPAEYGGPEVAAQQRAGYPDLGPLILSAPPDPAFEKALRTARSMRWRIVDANRTERRIEATGATFWFGFKDDIVVRVSPSDSGSRIDVRSVSRVGRSDVGTNAERIRKYLKKLKQSD